MSQTDLVDVLENCLQKLEAGVPLEVILANYPDQREELRELLLTALAAQSPRRRARIPASAQVDSRRRLLARAEELVEQNHRRGFIAQALRLAREHFQSAAIVLVMLVLLFIALRSVGALPAGLRAPQPAANQGDPALSSSAVLPAGAGLPATAADQLNQAITADQQLAGQVESMISARQPGEVVLPGFLKAQNGGWAVGGAPIQLPPALEEQAQALSGAYVEVKGRLDGSGALLAEDVSPRVITLEGRLERTGSSLWFVDGLALRVSDQTEIAGAPQPGERVQARVSRLEGQDELLALSITGSRPSAPVSTPSPEAAPQDNIAAPESPEPNLTAPQPSPTPRSIPSTGTQPSTTGHDEPDDKDDDDANHDNDDDNHSNDDDANHDDDNDNDDHGDDRKH